MAIGKNKKMGKKGAKKKVVDPFTRKEWYDVVAPAVFHKRQVGKTVVNRTQGTHTAEDSLKGRVFEVSLGDLGSNPEVEFRKFRLICEDVQKNRCLTNFHGMDFTRDKLCAIVRKWHTLVEANAKVKTTDGYLLRLFCTGFSRRAPAQIKKTTYIKKSKVKAIRAKMVEIMVNEVSSSDLRDLCKKLIPDTIGKDIEKACARIYPMQDVYVRKVKVLKKPKYDINRLLSMHTDEEGAVATTDEATGERVYRYASYEPPVQESV